MARKKSSTLTDAEVRLMDVIWDKGEASVSDVVDCVSKDVPLAYSTVLTTLRILENKGYIRHRKDGRAFIYQAAVPRGDAQKNAIAYVLERFCDDSPALLMLNLPRKSSRQGQRSALRHLIDKFYDGSTEKIVAALLGVKGSKLSREELDRIAAMVEKARKEGR
jgi:predicted transcriptional regulator